MRTRHEHNRWDRFVNWFNHVIRRCDRLCPYCYWANIDLERDDSLQPFEEHRHND